MTNQVKGFRQTAAVTNSTGGIPFQHSQEKSSFLLIDFFCHELVLFRGPCETTVPRANFPFGKSSFLPTFVDHANRRGSLRIDGDGRFRFAAPSPFALLPYGLVRYHGSPADLRDIPLGTVMYAKAFLPPDPKISSVPVLPLDNREKKYGYAGTGVAPAENHIFLFEDEPSYCKRLGLVWKLKEINLKEDQGILTARRESKSGNGDVHEETFSIDKPPDFGGEKNICI